MSVGFTGLAGSVAGSQLPQVKGTDVERSQNEMLSQARQVRAAEQSESAAGVGQTEEDQETSDRDADGRRLWEAPPGNRPDPAPEAAEAGFGPRSKDPTGERGQNLDLSG
jgi:hypothetical protein